MLKPHPVYAAGAALLHGFGFALLLIVYAESTGQYPSLWWYLLGAWVLGRSGAPAGRAWVLAGITEALVLPWLFYGRMLAAHDLVPLTAHADLWPPLFGFVWALSWPRWPLWLVVVGVALWGSRER